MAAGLDVVRPKLHRIGEHFTRKFELLLLFGRCGLQHGSAALRKCAAVSGGALYLLRPERNDMHGRRTDTLHWLAESLLVAELLVHRSVEDAVVAHALNGGADYLVAVQIAIVIFRVPERLLRLCDGFACLHAVHCHIVQRGQVHVAARLVSDGLKEIYHLAGGFAYGVAVLIGWPFAVPVRLVLAELQRVLQLHEHLHRRAAVLREFLASQFLDGAGGVIKTSAVLNIRQFILGNTIRIHRLVGGHV